MSDPAARDPEARSADGGAWPRTLDRRAFLARLGAFAGLGAAGLAACDSPDTAPFVAELQAITPDAEAAAAIGDAFLEQTSGVSRRRLAARLMLELEWRPGVERAVLTERLLARIAADFRDGRTLRVDQWVLSQTEVWWAALMVAA